MSLLLQQWRREMLTGYRMFIPVADKYQQFIWVYDKKEDGSVEKTRSFGVQYVPLTDAPAER